MIISQNIFQFWSYNFLWICECLWLNQNFSPSKRFEAWLTQLVTHDWKLAVFQMCNILPIRETIFSHKTWQEIGSRSFALDLFLFLTSKITSKKWVIISYVQDHIEKWVIKLRLLSRLTWNRKSHCHVVQKTEQCKSSSRYFHPHNRNMEHSNGRHFVLQVWFDQIPRIHGQIHYDDG